MELKYASTYQAGLCVKLLIVLNGIEIHQFPTLYSAAKLLIVLNGIEMS